MSSTDTPSPTIPSPGALLWRWSWSYLLFSVLLLGLLVGSWNVLLPRYTRVNVNGEVIDSRDIPEKKRQLEYDIAQAEEKRMDAVVSIHDPLYRVLVDTRANRRTLRELRSVIAAHCTKVTGRDDIVHLQSLDLRDHGKTLVIQGDVRNVGQSSMTVLATLAASITDMPFVASSTAPPFSRIDEKGIGPHSPFTITLTLHE